MAGRRGFEIVASRVLGMSRVGGYYVCQEGEVRCRYRGVEVAAGRSGAELGNGKGEGGTWVGLVLGVAGPPELQSAAIERKGKFQFL